MAQDAEDDIEAEYWAAWMELDRISAEIKNLCIIAKESNKLPHELFIPGSPMPMMTFPIWLAFMNWVNEETNLSSSQASSPASIGGNRLLSEAEIRTEMNIR